MNEIKFNIVYRIMHEGIALVAVLLLLFKLIFDFDNVVAIGNLYAVLVMICVLTFLLYIMHFTLFNKPILVLTQEYIQQGFSIVIFERVIYERKKRIFWKDVDSFEHSYFAGYWAGYRLWGESNYGKNSLMVMNSIVSTFNEDDRVFIINHIDQRRIHKSAYTKVKKLQMFSK